MNFLNSIKSFFKKVKAGYIDGPISMQNDDPFTLWGDKAKIPKSKAMESYSYWTYACIRAIAEEIAAMKLIVKEGGPEGKEVDQSPMLDLLSAPNEFLTGYNLLFKTAASLELCGNAYWYLGNVKDEFSEPQSLSLLNAGKIKPIIDRTGIIERIVGYKYRKGTVEFTLQPYEILHFQYPDPCDDIEGVGTVQSIAKWIDADNYAMETNRRFFMNGARIGGFLESETAVTPAALDYLTKSFSQTNQGVDNFYKTIAMPKGVKYNPASTSVKDMDFVNLSNEMQKRILGGFRVPKSVLGVTEDVNRANAEASNYIFALRTIKPKMDQIISILNAFFAPRFSDTQILDYKDPVPENTDLKIKEMVAVTASHQIKTVNEVRAENYGLDPVEGGDELDPNAGPTPAPEGSNPAEPKKTVKLFDNKIVKNIDTPKTKDIVRPQSMFARNLKRKRAIADELSEKIIKSMEENMKQSAEIKKKSVKDMTDEDWNVLAKEFNKRVGEFEKTMNETMVKFNSEQRDRVLANLESAIKKTVDKKKLLNKNQEVTATIDLIEPIVNDVYVAEGAKAAELLGFTGMDITTQEAVKAAIHKRVALMAENYTQTTLDNLATVVEQEIAKGTALAGIKEAVTATYSDWNGWRAEMVAKTETFAAANSATKEAWKQTGVVKTIKWFTSEDDRVCDWCNAMDGKVVGIDEDFYEKGDSMQVADKVMKFDYDDISNPPLHVNCNCYVKPEEISIED